MKKTVSKKTADDSSTYFDVDTITDSDIGKAIIATDLLQPPQVSQLDDTVAGIIPRGATVRLV